MQFKVNKKKMKLNIWLTHAYNYLKSDLNGKLHAYKKK